MAGMSDFEFDLDAAPGYLSPSLKMGWAKHHLRALDEEIGKFLKSEPYTISTQDDLEAGEHVLHFKIGAVPIRPHLMVGDFASCLRASLDHLASALTLAPGGVPNDRASFPVIGVDNSDGRTQFKKAVIGIRKEAVDVIKALQPYHHGDAYKATKLWRLHRLWNIDKHRRIPVYGVSVQVPLICPVEMSPVTSRTDDGEVMRFPLAAKGHIYLQPPVKLDVYCGDASEGIAIPLRELIEIHDFIAKEVFPRFRCFF